MYEPLEDFSKVYEEVDPNEESDITTNTVNETDGKSDITNIVNKMDGKSPPSNQESDVTSAVSGTDDKVAVPIESLQVPAGSNDHISKTSEFVTLLFGDIFHCSVDHPKIYVKIMRYYSCCTTSHTWR